jgi:hypothetical protein
MGFDPRRLRSVTGPEQIASHPLGTRHAAGVRVVTSWGSGLNAVYRAALCPELHVYSWQGHVEVDDFDPPLVHSVAWDQASGELVVKVHDPAGVACVRLGYDYDGRRYRHDLRLTGGDKTAGAWRVPFAAGAVVKSGDLTAVDELFNAQELPIAW